MWTITKPFCLALLCVLLFSSCSKEELPTDKNLDLTYEKLYDNLAYSPIEQEIVNLVNEHRASLGLEPLAKVDEVTIQADDHTKYMIQQNQVSHDNFGKRYEALVTEIGAKAVGENVGYGYHSAKGVVDAWIKSDGHRANIEGNFTHFGISVDKNADGRNYFTNIFVRR